MKKTLVPLISLVVTFGIVWSCAVAEASAPSQDSIDLTNAVIVTRSGTLPKAEQKAAVVLVEEIEKRTGLTWTVTTTQPATGTVIALASQSGTGIGPEGYHLFVEGPSAGLTVLRVVGADARGVLYGVGKLLRSVTWATGSVSLAQVPDVTSAPVYPIRGHQIGYRNTANSYDAWSVAQYEQYIRELVIFGANSIENIPFDTPSPHFQVTQAAMTSAVSGICDDYGIDYWVWTPAPDLSNPTLRAQALAQHDALYASCVRLNGVFVPGGDPGSNAPELVFPFLQDLATRLTASHPGAGVWVSNQGFEPAANNTFFNYLQTNQPDWLAGVVYGPWTKLTSHEERTRTPSKYPIRMYPDITHNLRCQFPVDGWDRAFAHTQGREASNPRPVAEAQIHNANAPDSSGFIAYSDGCHDDVNKQVWSMRGWDPNADVADIVTDYARFFFGSSVATQAANGILALEQNWTGRLATNAGVDATLAEWQQMETQNSGLANNWRWQFCLLRAYCDKYTKDRLAYEASLENQADAALADAAVRGAGNAMSDAETLLAQATSTPVRMDLRTRIGDLCLALFQTIQYQSSVQPPYRASGLERSCVLDLVDWPINDRSWLQNQFTSIRALGTEAAKLSAINGLLHWEDPGPGGYYDDLGNTTKQAHLIQQKLWSEDPGYVESTQDEFGWHNGDRTSLLKGAGRLSWQDQAQTLYGQPLQLRYTGLGPNANYTVRATYLGRFGAMMTMKADGAVLGTTGTPGSVPYQVQYPIPQAATADGVLDLTWDLVTGRGCQVAEVWLTTPDVVTRPADIDGSGVINAIDVQLVINGALGLGTEGRNADVNGDGRVDAIDVQLVINGALGL